MLRIEQVSHHSKEQIEQFIKFPFKLYKENRYWTPLLNIDARTYFDRNKFPFYEHSDAAFFLAYHGTETVGRIVAIDHALYNNYQDKNSGNFYFFDCIDNSEIAFLLLDAASAWLKNRGLDSIVGPKGFGAIDGYGTLIEGFDYSQTMSLTTYQHPYHQKLIEAYGFKPEVDFISSEIDIETLSLPSWVHDLADHVKSQEDLKISNYKSLWGLVRAGASLFRLYNESFLENWEFYPLPDSEIKFLVNNLTPIGFPSLTKLIYKNDEMVGLIIGFHDISNILRRFKGQLSARLVFNLLKQRRKRERVTILAIALKSPFQNQGYNAVLISEIEKTIRKLGIKQVELINMAETATQMRRDLQSLNLKETKKHRVYAKSLKPKPIPNVPTVHENEERPIPDKTPAESFQTIINLMEHRATLLKENVAFSFLANGEEIERQISYQQLADKAKAIGHYLTQQGASDQPVLLSFPPGLDFIEAFLGCLYAGAIAVPTHFPNSKRLLPRFVGIINNCDAQFCLTLKANQPVIAKICKAHALSIATIPIDQIPIENGRLWTPPKQSPDDIAFLQYTSGSSGSPKGVKISHGNLLSNLQTIRESFEIWEGGRSLFWLPSTHDMGLIGGILEPILIGWETFLMSPHSFAEKPGRWIQTLSKYNINITGAPNFALDYVTDRMQISKLNTIDLSQLEILFCGSENVRATSLSKFQTFVEPLGFRPEVYLPCYGMAETTLLVSGAPKNNTPQKTSYKSETYVSCGNIHASFTVRIVDPDLLTALENGYVGEVWIAGPSVSSGYWNNPEDTAAFFNQILDSDPEYQFFRSGDLGFIKNGELYITGRLKDLIIHNGQNYFPDDIEEVIEASHEAIQPHGVAAVSVDNDQSESVILICELKRAHRKSNLTEIASAIHQNISQAFQLPVQKILFLNPGKLIRTSSGKIARAHNKEAYLQGKLSVLGEQNLGGDYYIDIKPVSTLVGLSKEENAIRDLFTELIGLPSHQIKLNKPLHTYGLGSLKAAAFSFELKNKFDIDIPAQDILSDITLQKIIEALMSEKQAK